MKAAGKVCSLVLAVLVFGGTVLAQDRGHGNLAEQQKAPTVLGGTGLFNTFSTRTLCKGEFNFALFWNNFDRDPGDLDINQVPFNFTIGLTNRWELWVDWVTWQQVTSRQPFLLSGYQLSATRLFGDPFTLLGPASGGNDGGAAFFPGSGAIFGGLLPSVGRYGTPTNFPTSVFSPGGLGSNVQVRGLGPLIASDLASYYNELPFFGETDFVGFDGLGRPVFGRRQSSNGSGDIYVGSKYSLIDPNKHWFSMALGGYLKIPVARGLRETARGRGSGEYEGGPILMFGQESAGKRVRLYENVGYIHTGDPEIGGVKVLDIKDKLLFNAGLSIAVNRHAEFITEIAHTRFIGGDTPSLIRNDPWDLNVGMRFFLKNGAISFGGAYRLFLNNEDDITLPVFKAKVTFVGPFFIINPLFEKVPQTFRSDGKSGFVGFFSIGTRRACPAPPAPTCVLSASTTVNRGERLSLSVKPSTPGYTDDKVTYEYRWDVKDAQGRPVTVSGSGASVDVSTSQLACGRYTVTTTVTASVPAVDCPTECVTTGQTSCNSSFEITEPPCPTVSCDVVGTPSTVKEGERVTFRATGSGGGNLTYTWSTTAGSLSSTLGAEVSLDTTGLAPGTVTVSVEVSTDRRRCDQPCSGGSCSTSITVERIPVPPPPEIVSPCGPIFFPLNSARINNEHKACLDEISLRLQQDPRAQVVIDGHRDSSERVGISLTRGNNARDYLVNEKGVDGARITVRNFGDTCAHESGDPNLNRRVEFWIVPEGANISAVDAAKKCAAGASPQIITTEQPAPSVEKRPARRAPRRRAAPKKPA
ncbi:MAG TPA: OmpA family protein [Blastocatellia bacterium]|nr:OmpA family protein [Blastocatellia bacterium]